MRQLISILCFTFICSSFQQSPNQQIPVKEIFAATSPISIDGIGNDVAWAAASWQNMNQNWIDTPFPTAADFTGKFKLLYDKNYIYLLVEMVDDVLIDSHADPLVDYWQDDCVEIFVDEDASGGHHRNTPNAFAYHVSMANNWIDFNSQGATVDFNTHGTMTRTNPTGTTHVWELRFQLYPDSYVDGGLNTPSVLTKGKKIGFMLAYCDSDSNTPIAPNTTTREAFMGSKVVPGLDTNRGYLDASIFDKYYLR